MSVLVRRQQLRRPPNKLHSTREPSSPVVVRRAGALTPDTAHFCSNLQSRSTGAPLLPLAFPRGEPLLLLLLLALANCTGKFAKVRPAQWSASKGNQCRLPLPGGASTSANTAAAAGPTQRDLRTLARNRLPNERHRRSSKQPDHLNPSRFLGPLFGATC